MAFFVEMALAPLNAVLDATAPAGSPGTLEAVVMVFQEFA